MSESYDDLYAHLDIIFYNGTKLNKRKTAEARKDNPKAAEVFDDIEMVEIRFPGMKDTMHQRAHQPCMQAQLSDGSRGGFITYAEKFHKHYEHWKAHGGGQLVLGTKIEEAPFLSKGQVESLKGLKILSVEQLATASESARKAIGPHASEWIERAQEMVASKTDAKELLSEVEQLKRELEALKGNTAPAPAPAPETASEPETVTSDDDFAGMDKAELRAWIKAKSGHAVKGQPSLETLLATARELNSEVAA